MHEKGLRYVNQTVPSGNIVGYQSGLKNMLLLCSWGLGVRLASNCDNPPPSRTYKQPNYIPSYYVQ